MGRTSDAKERLMTAALDLMWEESYGAITIDTICTRADVKKGSFYYFFNSKADLAVAALENLWEVDMKPKMDARFSSSLDPLTRLKTYLEVPYTSQCLVKQQHGKALGCPIFSMGTEICTHESEVNAKIREIVSRKRRYVESAIRDAVAEGVIEPCDPAQKALALACLIDGTMSQARIMNDVEVLKNLPALGMDLLHVKEPATAR
jgi:TetR/AcrR family transcriptional repressor of nem operon